MDNCVECGGHMRSVGIDPVTDEETGNSPATDDEYEAWVCESCGWAVEECEVPPEIAGPIIQRMYDFGQQLPPLTADELRHMRETWTIDDAIAAGFKRDEILADAAALEKRLAE